MSGFAELRFAGLDAHIARVDDVVVAPMREAAGAGRPLDPLAYGVIGQVFAGTIAVAAAYAAQSVGRLAEEAIGFRERLVDTERAYRRTERANAGSFAGTPLSGTPVTGTEFLDGPR